ncbi:MAG TPA: DUF2339 domain-containing protein, partial [Candidatus Hydrogenedentes bacterium]|nr:DUF2339 domain-containing protein [Candidatus Hydrogenedentota bacterium]
GLATLYFTTYAAFFVDEMRVSGRQVLGIPLLLVCLGALAGVSHWRRSQTVAGVSLFLVYYTVVASCMSGANGENLYYGLLTCAMLAVVAVAFHALHRWFLFAWGALIATYAVYLYFFLVKPGGLDMPDREYFWLSNGFLAVCYVSFALAGIADARKTGEYRRGIAPMTGVNSCVFIVLGWYAVRHAYPHEEWMFRLGFAGLLFGFAALLHVTGPRGNYLYQVYIAKSVVMATLALQAYFSGEKLMVAISLECLALAFSYKRSGLVTFKLLGLLLLFVTFLGSMFHLNAGGTMSVAGYAIGTNWFCCAGSAIVLCVVSGYYARFVRRVRPADRVAQGQWFLADTIFDVRSRTVSLMYAMAAAVILMAVTVADRGGDVRMPYLLAMEGLLLVAVGGCVQTPQLAFGGILLFAAAHAAYHMFLIGGMPGFDTQPRFAFKTIALALLTFAGAGFWDRYLRRTRGGQPWDHDAMAALPSLAATVMLTAMIKHLFAGMWIPFGQNLLAVGLFAAGVVLSMTSMKAAGLVALGAGTISLFKGIYLIEPGYHREPCFLIWLAMILLAYVAGERFFLLLERPERTPPRNEEWLRTAIVVAGALVGLAGVSRYAPDAQRTLYWLGLAVFTVVIGVAVRESRYRWIALILFAAAIVRAYAYDLRSLPPFYQFLSFAALSVPLIAISWGYSHYRSNAPHGTAAPAEKDSHSDETAS